VHASRWPGSARCALVIWPSWAVGAEGRHLVRPDQRIGGKQERSRPPEVYFTTSHFNGYPAVLVRLAKISVPSCASCSPTPGSQAPNGDEGVRASMRAGREHHDEAGGRTVWPPTSWPEVRGHPRRDLARGARATAGRRATAPALGSAMKYRMSPCFTHSWNWARVGVGSDPLQPPMAMTALPLASSRPAALWSPTVAAGPARCSPTRAARPGALLEVAPAGAGELPCAFPPTPGTPEPDGPFVRRARPPGGWPFRSAERSGPPRPARVAAAGPADGMEPLCGVRAVLSAYALEQRRG
jgi:hypothetical protein